MTTGSTPTVALSGLGVVSSLGRDVATSCAAARAGIVRAAELDVINFLWDEDWGGEPIHGHVARGIADGCVGVGKVVLLGAHGLADLISRCPLSGPELLRTGFHLNLADRFVEDVCAAPAEGAPQEARPGAAAPSQEWHSQAAGLSADLLQRAGISIAEKNQRVYFEGHTGIVMAAAEAAMRMQSGELDRCIVGGVECCFEPRFLAACAKKALLKTAVSPVGFMPGEAAAFFLLEDVGKARARRAMISAHLGGASVVRGQSHRFSDDPPLGRAIHQAVQGALTQRPPAERAVAFVLGDLNGDEHRAMEWGHALVRLNAEFGLGTAPLWLPALSFGETGAATGALSVCLAARAFDRGYAPGGTALVWLLSESGAAAAFTLSRPPAGGS